ncbi:hypothetical protein, partial [Mycobacterium sp.]|uniref:hypothetical protein n=1 Tax=Mycobacterium sp. TaxID=1785 RepID=UPI003F9825CF
MTRRDSGPPERERPGASAGPIQKSGPHQAHQPAPAYSRFGQCGRYADAWRWGFGCGFRDAVRIVGREIDDPAVWVVLAELADRYE